MCHLPIRQVFTIEPEKLKYRRFRLIDTYYRVDPQWSTMWGSAKMYQNWMNMPPINFIWNPKIRFFGLLEWSNSRTIQSSDSDRKAMGSRIVQFGYILRYKLKRNHQSTIVRYNWSISKEILSAGRQVPPWVDQLWTIIFHLIQCEIQPFQTLTPAAKSQIPY